MAACAGEHRVIRRVGVACSADSICVAMVEREEGMVTCRQRSRNPRRCRMARDAGRRPACGHVVGVGGPCKIRLVAGITAGWRSREHIVHVALDAVHCRVRPSERERCVVVIERRPCPCGCRMARVASRREAGRSVVRVGSAIPVRRVAAVAVCGQGCEVIVGVARRTSERGVCARQRKYRRVIERGRAPGGGRVTDRAIRWEPRGDVIGIRGSGEICLVAGVACSRR